MTTTLVFLSHFSWATEDQIRDLADVMSQKALIATEGCGTKPSTDVFYALGDPDCKVYLVYDDMFVISTDYSSGLIMKTRDGLTGFPMYQNSDLSQLKFDIKVARSTSLTY